MKIFSYLYNRTMYWASHRHAHYFLAAISFIEAMIFPIPPDFMLISMALVRPKRAFYYAFIVTLFSVLGGIAGYILGYYAMAMIKPIILSSSLAKYYHQVVYWFSQSGVWIVIFASFTPFPYKIFTITAGAMHMAFFPFVIGSILGRGSRFFLLAGILFFTGEQIAARLHRYIDVIGWTLIGIILLVSVLFKWVI